MELLRLAWVACLWSAALLNVWLVVDRIQAGRPAAWNAVGAAACILSLIVVVNGGRP